MRIMYDGVNSLAHGIAEHFPTAEMIGLYVDGQYAWGADERALFPHAVQVEISVNAANKIGDVLDVERGDADPSQAHDWIVARRAAGLERPTIYCSYATVPEVRLETRELRLGIDYDIWVAKYDGTTDPPPMPGTAARYAAKQWSSTPAYDLSVVYDDLWPHRKPAAGTQLPAPAALSGTGWEYLHLAWALVLGADGYLLEVEPGGAGSWTEQVPAAGFDGHWQSKSFRPGPCMWRVQAQPGGAWSQWRQA